MIGTLLYGIGLTILVGYLAVMIIDRVTCAYCEINEEDDIY